MATLTLNQANQNENYAQYSGTSYYIDETSSGWYLIDEDMGDIYGALFGNGITYDSNGYPVLGTINSASCLDRTGAPTWTISDISLAANSTSNMRSILRGGDPFEYYYMIRDILNGDDTIIGSSGNDVIYYSDGSDKIDGGAGTDWMKFSNISYYSVNVNLAAGTYRLTLSDGVVISTIKNIENIVGSGESDTLIGNAANNIFIGRGGNDLIDGGAGIDTVSYAGKYGVDANLSLSTATEKYNSYGSTYTDTLNNIENLTGTSYKDTLIGNAGNNVLTGGAGDDTLDGKQGNDTADYSTAYKSVTVNLSKGVATGQGADKLSNIENVNGSTYGDTLIGNGAANTLNGNGGNDTLVGGAGNDALIGGSGIDQANYDAATAAVKVNLALLVAQNTGGAGIDKLGSIENLLGSSFNDVLTGNGFANKLTGGKGNDTLNGAAGNDLLIGGAGKDQMTGGAGADNFVFNLVSESAAGANKDTITDFLHGTDKINLSGIDADVFNQGNQKFTLISGSSAFSHAGQIKFSGGILSGEVTGDAIADFQIALTGVTSFTAVDVIL